jgi:hypothetical protein
VPRRADTKSGANAVERKTQVRETAKTTPPPRSSGQDEEVVSAEEVVAVRVGDGVPSRVGGKARGGKGTKPRKRNLTLSAEADERLGCYALKTGEDKGAIVSRIIVTYVPRYELRRVESQKTLPDNREDRPNSEAA